MDYNFSKWGKWSTRERINGIKNPWIYILAIFNEKVNINNINLTDKNIIYIWETCNQTLKQRLLQFNKSAFENKPWHSWGWSYSDKYNSNFDKNSDNLYLSICPITDDLLPASDVEDKKILLDSFIRYIERKVILEYVLINWNSNLLNKK